MKNIISIKCYIFKMFIESVQYSLQKVKVVVKNFKQDQNVLPVSTAKDNVKCLDFDMDTVVFRAAPKSPTKLAGVNPYNKTLLEVMEMV
jgi:hypothetical protein